MIEGIKPIVSWSDEWATGVAEIDNDHRHLVELIQKLFHSMMTEKGTAFINNIFIELIEYTKTHFDREEAVFERFGFDELDHHKILHKQLIDEVVKKGQHILREGSKQDLSFELLNFLKDWLVNHIIREDLKFKTYLIEHNIQVK